MILKSDKVNVLGTEYSIKLGNHTEFPPLREMDGYTDVSIHTIVVDDMNEARGSVDSKQDLDSYQRCVLRHELTHAFLYESGLAENTSNDGAWATNEEMVDWIAIQFPKMLKAFEEVGCI